MLRIAVLGSGRGSNFQAILDAIRQGSIPDARVCVVISNLASAGILDIARASSLPAVHLSQKQFASEEAFAGAMIALLREHDTGLVALAGYLKRLPASVVREYRGRILNIHPALLPRFGGKGMYGHHVHEAVIQAGERISGATVHFVDEEFDHGPILLQRTVVVDPSDTPDSLAAKILRIEHQLYPQAISMIARTTAAAGDH